MTHVLISADMEGITGVTCPADVEPGTDGWRGFRQLMASDVNAAVEGFFAAGASAVTVNDAHATKRNIPIEALDERATLITGTHKRLGMMEGIADGVDAVAFVGYHTGAGRQGVLSHTYIGTTILDVRINGQQAGEGRMNALLAAEHGVPVVLVTGDDLTCEDASRWAPDAERVAVKTCVDRYTARCLPPARTRELIAGAARRALARRRPPPRPEGPFTYEVEFDSVQAVVATTAIPSVTQTGERSVSFTLETMDEAIRCFRAVSALALASTEPAYG
ncbi:MAG TPA: M55 family metallopeptidase [Solirubrobacteraceae bacterium]|nr:M55 family metallopeptidase [Solirubrobacteraceae bacterium]